MANTRFNVLLTVSGWKAGLRDRAVRFLGQLRARNAQRYRVQTDARPAGDLVWRYSPPMEERGTRWVPHRVVQRTGRSIQVEAEPFVEPSQPGRRGAARRARRYWIDRDELDRLGFARVPSRRTVFFEKPQASNRTVGTIESLLRLGLWFPFDEYQLLRAYRCRARQVHPDAGGTDEQFVQLQHDYQRARSALQDRLGSR